MQIDLSQVKPTKISAENAEQPSIMLIKVISGDNVMCTRLANRNYTRFLGIVFMPDGRAGFNQFWWPLALVVGEDWMNKFRMLESEAPKTLADAYLQATSGIALASSMPQQPMTRKT